MYDSVEAFLSMGGYAEFIWPSYAICFGLIIGLTVQSVLSWRRRQAELTLLRESRARRTDAGTRPTTRNTEETAA
jgi:heme exporter protein D